MYDKASKAGSSTRQGLSFRMPSRTTLYRVVNFWLLFTSAILVAGCNQGDEAAPTRTDQSASADRTTLPPADDLPETGLQGQIPITDQLSGRSAQGYRKGLRLVGENSIFDRGSNFSMAWLDDCAYITQVTLTQGAGIGNLPLNPALNGMAVIDASNPKAPELVDIIQSPALLRPHEALHANEKRKIIVVTLASGELLEVWDAKDCRNPVLVSTLTIPGHNGHALCLTPDGMTAIATDQATGEIGNAIIDISDIRKPKLVMSLSPSAHDCGVNKAGDRLYMARVSYGLGAEVDGTGHGPTATTGLLIYDLAPIKERGSPPAQLNVVGSLLWTSLSEDENNLTGAQSHTAKPFTTGGRRYVYSNDEVPTTGACPYTRSRIIDVTDEKKPVKVSDIVLEAQKSANCGVTNLDLANYSSHYVGFDDDDNASLLFISAYAAGLRVFDIKDPAKPREIAYWHPAPNAEVLLSEPGPVVATGINSMVDVVASYIRYRPETGHIWIASYSRGLQILEFTKSAFPDAGTSVAK